MNSNQLEAVATKQEKFIKHLRLLYHKQWEQINPIILKFEETKDNQKVVSNQNQENNSTPTNEEDVVGEMNFKIFEQTKQPLQDSNLLDIQSDAKVDNNEYLKLKEEVERLQRQCGQVCEEMRRLQEENDDLTVAYEGEKNHKDRLMNSKKNEIDELTFSNTSLQEKLNNLLLELEALTFQVEFKDKEIIKMKQQIQLVDNQNMYQLKTDEGEQIKQNLWKEDQLLITKKMENKINQDSLKLNTLHKDIERLLEDLSDKKTELGRLFADKMKLEQIIIQLRVQVSPYSKQKRQRDKETLFKQEELCQAYKYEIEQLKVKHNEEVQTHSLNQFKEEINEVIDDTQPVSSLTIFQQDNEIKELKQTITLNEKHVKNLFEQIEEKDIKLHAMQDLVQVLQKKREFAISEISHLTDIVIKLQKQTGGSPHLPVDARHAKKKIQVFQTLKKVAKDIRKLIEELYKEFVNVLISLKDSLDVQQIIHLHRRVQNSLLSIEKKINDCNRKTQDFLDLFDDIGV